MTHISRFRSGAGLVLLILLIAGCASSPDRLWTVRTSSTPLPLSSDLASIKQEAVGLLTPFAPPALRGNEVALSRFLDDIIKKIFPTWKVIGEQQTINLINRYGLAG